MLLSTANIDDAIIKDGKEPATKKPRISDNGDSSPSSPNLRDLSVEVEHFAQLLSEAID